ADAAAAFYEQAVGMMLPEADRVGRLDERWVHDFFDVAARAAEALLRTNPRRAEALALRCLEAVRWGGTRQGPARVLLARARALRQLGQLRDAKEVVLEGLRLVGERVNLVLRAELLSELGSQQEASGDYVGATESVLAALRTVPGGQGREARLWRLLNQLGRLHLRVGELERAMEFLQNAVLQAQQFSDDQGEATALCNLAAAVALRGDRVRAETLLQQALAAARAAADRILEIRIHYNLGRLYAEDASRAAEAYEHLTVARRLAEQMEWAEGLADAITALERLNSSEGKRNDGSS
ncbi:hypothetical protein D6833_12675, partial [Candidatus Parcubacteria bacterium]